MTLNLKKNNTKFKDILADIPGVKIDEQFTKPDKSVKVYNKYIDSTVPVKNFNYMSDLIELPTTKKKYKWLLVVLDLATNLCDFEPMTNKTAKATLEAFKEILKRKILKIPHISMKTDNGGEFMGTFDKFLEENGVFHKFSMPYRKSQMAPVENLNGTLGRLLTNYMNAKSVKQGEDYCEWTDVLKPIRDKLNKFRERDLNELRNYQKQQYFDPDKAGKAKFKEDDYVYYRLDQPVDVLGQPVADKTKFRQGDRRFSFDSKRISEVLQYPSEPYYRYKLDGMPNVSYTTSQLKKARRHVNTYVVNKIIDRKMEGRKVFYKVWWKKFRKGDATWEPKAQLIKDGVKPYIDEYEENH
jgi:hypothetical protein